MTSQIDDSHVTYEIIINNWRSWWFQDKKTPTAPDNAVAAVITIIEPVFEMIKINPSDDQLWLKT